MPRKPGRISADWKPNPEADAAFARIIDTAHLCAAALFGERPVAEPEKNAPPHLLQCAGGMLYFLCRIDPKDMVALASGPGSFADFNYRPFPLAQRLRLRPGQPGPEAG